MSETTDANKLANLLKQQKELATKLEQLAGEDRIKATQKLKAIRGQCVTLVDRYFRQVLEPTLARQFPQKVYRGQPNVNRKADVGVMVQFTQLLNDFFVQVLSNFEDPFWRKNSAVELRNFAAWAIANDVRDELRRRKTGESATESYFWKSKFADDIKMRFSETGLNLTSALEVLDQWEEHDNSIYREYAHLIRHFYISDMTMKEIAREQSLSLSTAYRRKDAAIQALRAATLKL